MENGNYTATLNSARQWLQTYMGVGLVDQDNSEQDKIHLEIESKKDAFMQRRNINKGKGYESTSDFMTEYYRKQQEMFDEMKKQTSQTEIDSDVAFYSATEDQLGDLRPKLRPGSGIGKGPVTLGSLKAWGASSAKEPEFFKKRDYDAYLTIMENKYPGFSRKDLAAIIFKESSNDPSKVNPKSNATGHFQFLPKVALERVGVSVDKIKTMSALEQLKLYDKYLSSWNYDGSLPLAVYQAAPGKASSLIGKPDSTIVYNTNSPAFKANERWRSFK